eukprot:SAG22_NODE_1957_length_3252_cov_3.620044_3_plen_180_part_01
MLMVFLLAAGLVATATALPNIAANATAPPVCPSCPPSKWPCVYSLCDNRVIAIALRMRRRASPLHASLPRLLLQVRLRVLRPPVDADAQARHVPGQGRRPADRLPGLRRPCLPVPGCARAAAAAAAAGRDQVLLQPAPRQLLRPQCPRPLHHAELRWEVRQTRPGPAAGAVAAAGAATAA